MALRAVTPGRVAYCSDCSAGVPPGAPACPKCHQPFLGEVEALLCTRCNFFAPRNSLECVNCGAKLSAGGIDDQFLTQLKENRPEPVRPVARPASSQTTVVASPTRGEPVPRLLEPPRQRDRQEPNRPVADLHGGREDIRKVEQGAQQPAQGYSGSAERQEEQLRERGAVLSTRVEELQRELEQWEQGRKQVEQREQEVDRREAEFRRILEHLRKREAEVEVEEQRLRGLIRDATQRETELKQRLAALNTGLTQITIEGQDQAVSEMRVRIADLEEQTERLIDERNRLTVRLTASDVHKEEVVEVLRFLDELLGKLSDAEIRQFARSKMFAVYERMLERYGV